ncbi:MAG: AAA family ATPase, partial [Lachnospiraceae bacterium]|nr:AAA family ATPase [Lachnospiraceae bacterium]
MRLVSCYIENFGKLHRFSYDFQEGLNVICEENGWGKTTLAAFLKAMFYGMECT